MLKTGKTTTRYADYAYWREKEDSRYSVWHFGCDIGPTSNDITVYAPIDIEIVSVLRSLVQETDSDGKPTGNWVYSNGGPGIVTARATDLFPWVRRTWDSSQKRWRWYDAGTIRPFIRFLHMSFDGLEKLSPGQRINRKVAFGRIANDSEIQKMWSHNKKSSLPMAKHLHLEINQRDWYSILGKTKNEQYALGAELYADPVLFLEDGIVSFQIKERDEKRIPLLTWSL